MKRMFFILFGIFYIINAISQVTQVDDIKSIKNKLPQLPRGTRMVYSLAELSGRYVFLSPDSAFFYGLEGMKLAQEIHDVAGENHCRVRMAQTYWSIGDFATAIKLVLPILKEIEASKDTFVIVLANVTLANNYRDQGDYSEALKYYLRLMEITRKGNQDPPRISLASAGGLYLKMRKLDSAQYFSRLAFTRPPDPGLIGWPYFIAAEIFDTRKNNDSAIYFYRKSILHFLEEENLKDVAGAYSKIAAIFRSENQIDSSVYYARQSLKVSLRKKFFREAMEASLQLSSVYEKRNIDSAFKYYKYAISIKDSLFSQEKQRQILGYQFNEQIKKQETEIAQTRYRNRQRTNLLVGTVFIFLLVGIVLWRNNLHKQQAKLKIEKAYDDLKATQQQLIQSEKMASLGQLTAGIAHEIQNPLNFVNNFSEVNKELLHEMQDEISAGNLDGVRSIAKDVIGNQEKINHHGKRAEAIVKGMLQHSRKSSDVKAPTDVNALADEYLRLAYHGLRTKDKSFNATLKTKFDQSIGKVNIIPQDIGRVILNLFTNAFYAVDEKRKKVGENFDPTVSVVTKQLNNKIEITVRDNGSGIPSHLIEKIFQPFFTTKPTGQGTGLGLSMSYDIITKTHGGELRVESREGEYSEFKIILPS